jgi:hypothetical protein
MHWEGTMQGTIKYRELVEMLSQPDKPRSRLVPDDRAATERRVDLQPKKPAFFVEPNLIVRQTPPGRAYFLLVSAPAAVGKSILAQALASELLASGRQVLYVPLRGAVIGDNYFAGLLASIFPKATKTEVLDSVVSGRTLVFFDGYDELSMTAEQSRLNERFVQEVFAEIAGRVPETNAAAVSVVFLFRSAIRSLGIFDSLLANAHELDLAYFSPDQQAEFLAAYLSTKRSGPAADPTTASTFLGALRGSLPGSPDEHDLESFLGHAPVLMALGDLLLEEKSQNFHGLAQNLARGPLAAEKWDLEVVKRIVDQLLLRESGKFPMDAFNQHGLSTFEAFPPDLQSSLLKRLLRVRIDGKPWQGAVQDLVAEECRARLHADERFPSLAASDAQRLEQAYVATMYQKIQQHPFLTVRGSKIEFTNPIYQEKYLAEFLLDQPDTEVPRIFYAFNVPSSYLAQFLVDSVPDRDLRGRHALIFFLIRSLSMGSREDFEARVTWLGTRWEVAVEAGRVRPAPFYFGDELFVLSVPDGQILENIVVDGRGAFVSVSVVEGEGGTRRITLSHVVLEADEVEIDATAVTCNAVDITAQRISFTEMLQQIEGADSLTLSGPVSASDFIRKRYLDVLAPRKSEVEADAVFLRTKLRQMLTWFRKRGAQSLGVFQKRFDTVVLRKGRDPDAKRVADFLFELGVLKMSEQMVVLDQEALAHYGVHYVKQNELAFKEGFDGLVTEWAVFRSR